MGRSGIVRRLRKSVRKYRARQRAKNRAAIQQAKQITRAQDEIRKSSRRTADEIQAEGGFTWEGAGLPGDTVMEPQMGAQGWEWVPVTVQPRRGKTGFQNSSQAPVCGAETQDGTPCQRRGNCPVPSHKKTRKARGGVTKPVKENPNFVHAAKPGEVSVRQAAKQREAWLSSPERAKWMKQYE